MSRALRLWLPKVNVSVDYVPQEGKLFAIAVDATGMKVTNRHLVETPHAQG